MDESQKGGAEPWPCWLPRKIYLYTSIEEKSILVYLYMGEQGPVTEDLTRRWAVAQVNLLCSFLAYPIFAYLIGGW